MTKPLSKQQALSRVANICAKSEKSVADIEQKLIQLKQPEANRQDILNYLVQQNFINHQRFAVAFVREKFNINKWGKQKISHLLYAKKIEPEYIHKALDEINQTQYLYTLQQLALQKLKTLSQNEEYQKKKQKIIRFLASRGFESNLALAATDRVLSEQNNQ